MMIRAMVFEEWPIWVIVLGAVVVLLTIMVLLTCWMLFYYQGKQKQSATIRINPQTIIVMGDGVKAHQELVDYDSSRMQLTIPK